MQNIKYHSINIISVVIFSLVTSGFISEIIQYNMRATSEEKKISRPAQSYHKEQRKRFSEYSIISDSGFFPPEETWAEDSVQNGQKETGPVASSLSDLSLMGTITGPFTIARALIQKRGEQDPKVYALYTINSNIHNNVFGYKLVRIGPSKVTLRKDREKFVLDLYAERTVSTKTRSRKTVPSPTGPMSKTLSRAEIMQRASNMMDLSKGLIITPHRVNGKVEGFRLKRIRPYNVLHKLGFRPGDIIKRINGKKIDNMQKAMSLWSKLKTESSFNVDLERGGRDTNMNFNITD